MHFISIKQFQDPKVEATCCWDIFLALEALQMLGTSNQSVPFQGQGSIEKLVVVSQLYAAVPAGHPSTKRCEIPQCSMVQVDSFHQLLPKS